VQLSSNNNTQHTLQFDNIDGLRKPLRASRRHFSGNDYIEVKDIVEIHFSADVAGKVSLHSDQRGFLVLSVELAVTTWLTRLTSTKPGCIWTVFKRDLVCLLFARLRSPRRGWNEYDPSASPWSRALKSLEPVAIRIRILT
jgi:hypothetical protein